MERFFAGKSERGFEVEPDSGHGIVPWTWHRMATDHQQPTEGQHPQRGVPQVTKSAGVSETHGLARPAQEVAAHQTCRALP